MTNNTTAFVGTLACRPTWQSWKMYPKLSNLGNDYEKWIEGWAWAWAWNQKSGSETVVREPRAAENEGYPKLPDPTFITPSKLRRDYLFSTPPTLSPVSSSSSSSSSSSVTYKQPVDLNSSSSLSPSPSDSFSSSSDTNIDTPPLFITEYFEVHKSKKDGYGAFASKDIQKDTIIMIEKPLIRSDFMEIFIELEKLTREERKEYRTLHGFKGLEPTRDLAIFKTNRFETSGGKGGIFLKSSRFNHACHPYATCTYYYDQIAGTLTVTACNPIKKGEEITISYTPTPSQLIENYGFWCDCPGCPSPEQAAKEARRLRGPR